MSPSDALPWSAASRTSSRSGSELTLSFGRRRYGLFGPSPGGSKGMSLLASGGLDECIRRALERRGRDEWLLLMADRGSGWEELGRADRFRMREIAHRRGHLIRYAAEEPLPDDFVVSDDGASEPAPA